MALKQRNRRLNFLAQVEALEPRWLMSTLGGGNESALVAEGEAAASTFAEPGTTIALPGNATMNNPTYGSTFRSALNGGIGYWDAASSWSAGRAPTATDKVIIAGGDTLIIRDTTAIAQAVGIYQGGKLQFATNVSTELKAVTVVVLGEFEMGTAAAPIDAAVTAKLTIRNVAIDNVADPGQWGNGLVVLGKIRVHGAVKDVAENRLTVQPQVGQNTLTFAHNVTGWRAGDKLFVPGTKQLTDYEYNTGVATGWESMTIASVSGNVVTLTAALTVNHLGATNSVGVVEFMPVVQNLTRNAVIKSESATGTRGHALFAGRADVDIRYATFGGLGRSQIGEQSNFRVPVHFYHLIGPSTPQANGYQYTFIGNAITCPLDPMPFKWGMLINNSHFGLIQNNDLNNWAGAGIVTLTGAETQNVLDGNRVMRITGTGERVDDTGEAGVGYWLRGPDNYVRNNIAANIKGGIYSYGFNASHGRFLGTVTLPTFQGADSSQAGQSVSVNMNFRPFREFRNNEVFATQNGMTIWWLGIEYETPADVESQLKDFKVWNVYNWGMFLYESNRLTIDGFRYLSTETSMQRTAITFTDYLTRRVVVQNSSIENGSLRLPLHADLRGTSAADQTVGRVVVKDSKFIDGSIWGTPQANVNGSGDLSKRVAIIINVTFQNSPNRISLDNDPSVTNGTPNLIPDNYAVIQNYNSLPGVNAEDFLVYAIYKTGPGTQQPNRSEIEGKIYNLVDSTAPNLSGIAVSGITNSSANISWNSSENSAFQVQYGTTSSYGEAVTHAGFATSRTLTLPNLKTGLTYHFRVLSWDAFGNLTSSADQIFDITPPVVTDAEIDLTGATGSGGAFRVGDTVSAIWNNNSQGNNNPDIASVNVNFSQFGGPAAVAATNSNGIWSADFTITSGSIDGTNKNVSVAATDHSGNSTTTADTTNATVDSQLAVVTDAKISLSGATGTSGVFRVGDTVTASWNNTAASGDNNPDIAGVTVNFGPFGGGVVTASHSSQTWTASYTLVAGSIDGTDKNVSVSATDDAGNLTTTADTTSATVDSQLAVVTDAKLSISGATGTGGAFRVGDTVTATWNNTSGGDNNPDIAGVSVNFSPFGGPASVTATNSSGTWTATYTLVAGTIDGTDKNVSVSATDHAGNLTTTADSTNATVDNTLPVVSSVTSATADGVYGPGVLISLQIVFSETVMVAGTPQLMLETGSLDRVANYFGGSGTTTLTFRYLVQSGDSSSDLEYQDLSALVLAGGSVVDSVGNDANTDLALPGTPGSLGFAADLLIDGLTPAVSVAELVTNTAFPTIAGSYNDPDPTGGITGISINVAGQVLSAVITSGIWSVVVPDALGEGTYEVVATITDAAGNTSTDTSADELVIDLTSPVADIVDIAPDPHLSGVGLVTINFSEPLSGLSAADFVLTADGQSLALTGDMLAEVSPIQFTLDLTTVAAVEGSYVLTLAAAGSGIADAAGNGLAADAADAWTINLNFAPTDISLSNTSVLENITGQTVGNFTAADPDAEDTHVFLISDSRFLLAGSHLSLAPDFSLDRTVETSVSLEVTVQDSGTPRREFTKTLVITILANPFPWQNKPNPLDTRNDGNVIPLDVLTVINEFNEHTISDALGRLPRTRPADSTVPYFDVNGDGFVGPIDALRIINKLNEPAGGEGEADEPLRAVFQPPPKGNSQADGKLSLLVPESAAPSTHSSRNARRKIPVDHYAGMRRVESNRPLSLQRRAAEDGDSSWSVRKDVRSELESILDEIALDVCTAKENRCPADSR